MSQSQDFPYQVVDSDSFGSDDGCGEDEIWLNAAKGSGAFCFAVAVGAAPLPLSDNAGALNAAKGSLAGLEFGAEGCAGVPEKTGAGFWKAANGSLDAAIYLSSTQNRLNFCRALWAVHLAFHFLRAPRFDFFLR